MMNLDSIIQRGKAVIAAARGKSTQNPPPKQENPADYQGKMRAILKPNYKPDAWAEADAFTQEEIEQHRPVQQLVRLDGNFKNMDKSTERVWYSNALSASTSMMRKKYRNEHIFMNPMQSLDYRVYEGLLKNTFIGALMDALVKFIIGSGFEPELELINPSAETSEENEKSIDDNQEIITRLKQIDRTLDSTGDVSFAQKVAALITSTLAYNRGALMFVNDGSPIKIDGQTYPDIPTHVLFTHARDLGMIKTDPYTQTLLGVQRFQDTQDFVPTDKMLYLWNPVTSAKIHNAWHYGGSILSPILSAAQLIDKLLAANFPAMADNAYTGLYLLIAKNEGNTIESKQAEFADLVNNTYPGKISVLLKDPEDVRLDNIQFDPKIKEFQELLEFLLALCIASTGLPQSGFYDEAGANRDTMAGKIQMTIQTHIEPMRRWIGEALEKQWYDRWFRQIYKNDTELLEKFRIRVKWTDLHISEWYDSVESVSALNELRPLKDNAIGELTHLNNYAAMVDQEKVEKMEQQEEKERQAALQMGQGMQSMGKPGGMSKPGGGREGRNPSSASADKLNKRSTVSGNRNTGGAPKTMSGGAAKALSRRRPQ